MMFGEELAGWWCGDGSKAGLSPPTLFTSFSVCPQKTHRLHIKNLPVGSLPPVFDFIYWHGVFHVYLSLTPLVWRTVHLRGAEAVIRLNSYRVSLLRCVSLAPSLPPHRLCRLVSLSKTSLFFGAVVLMLWFLHVAPNLTQTTDFLRRSCWSSPK